MWDSLITKCIGCVNQSVLPLRSSLKYILCLHKTRKPFSFFAIILYCFVTVQFSGDREIYKHQEKHYFDWYQIISLFQVLESSDVAHLLFLSLSRSLVQLLQIFFKLSEILISEENQSFLILGVNFTAEKSFIWKILINEILVAVTIVELTQ